MRPRNPGDTLDLGAAHEALTAFAGRAGPRRWLGRAGGRGFGRNGNHARLTRNGLKGKPRGFWRPCLQAWMPRRAVSSGVACKGNFYKLVSLAVSFHALQLDRFHRIRACAKNQKMNRPARDPLTPPWPFEAYAHIVSPCPGRPGEYQVTLPDLPEFLASGHSQADALANARASFPSHIQRRAHISRGKVPAPKFAPRPQQAEWEASGKFVIRLGVSLHSELRQQAAFDGISMNALIAQLLAVNLRSDVQPPPSHSSPKSRKGRSPQEADKATTQFLARIPSGLHVEIAIRAIKQGVSMNLWVVTKLAAQLSIRNAARRPATR